MLILEGNPTEDRDQTEAFSVFAERRRQGDVIVPPLLLPEDERRLYVRQTLREDHQYRIRNRPEGAQAKFDKLADDPFDFFRGTALLYYRDYAGLDADLPVVFTLGDVHPENFGVMPNDDGAPVFSANDFDEAYFAPFSYDVRRGAVGFYLACKRNGFKKKVRRAVVRAFVEGYLDGLKAFAKDDREQHHEYRIDNSPPMIKALLEGARTRRRDFLEEKVDFEERRFRPTEEIVPHSKHVQAFQAVVDVYVDENDLDLETRRDGFFTVRDVAIKKGSGTASLGLDRYWVLVEGPSEDLADDVILELKQARRSALHGLVPGEDASEADEAGTVVEAHDIHLAGGDLYYGRAEVEGEPFVVRERSPLKDDLDVDDLDEEAMHTYADLCGRVLSQPHARSDEDTGVREGNAEEAILSAVHPTVFADDIVRFAERAAKRVRKDWKLFKKDHALGAFDFTRG